MKLKKIKRAGDIDQFVINGKMSVRHMAYISVGFIPPHESEDEKYLRDPNHPVGKAMRCLMDGVESGKIPTHGVVQ